MTSLFFDNLISTRGLTREQVRKDLKISQGRLVTLLRGDGPWYLEDVQQFCEYFSVDLPDFMTSLQSQYELMLSGVIDTTVQAEELGMVADKHDGEVGAENDEGFMGA